MDYQFRTDVMATLNRLTDAVLEANKSVKTLNNGNNSLHHKSTPLFQSFINQHTANLVTCCQTQAAKPLVRYKVKAMKKFKRILGK